MTQVSTRLLSTDVEELFSGAVDGALGAADDARLKAALAADPALARKFQQYQRTIALLKGAPREKAPAMLATTIMRRVRRRRAFDRRNVALQQVMYRVPVEVIIPVLLGVMVAALLFFAAP
jgi:anti-sigma factor RsiW